MKELKGLREDTNSSMNLKKIAKHVLRVPKKTLVLIQENPDWKAEFNNEIEIFQETQAEIKMEQKILNNPIRKPRGKPHK